MISQAKTGVFTAADSFATHVVPPDYYEQPGRVVGIERRAIPKLDKDAFAIVTPTPATMDQLKLVHAPRLPSRVRQACKEKHSGLFDGNVNLPFSSGTFDAASLAFGAGINAVDAVMAGTLGNAFCVIRPPGHHVGHRRPEGFGFFNNVAGAAEHLRVVHGLTRILILDWDLHHGDGTQEIFFGHGGVYVINLHGDPSDLYPFKTGFAHEIGEDVGAGFNLNIPLPKLSGDDAVLTAFDKRVLPAIELYQPQFILVSCGFDAHMHDKYKYLRWSSNVYDKLTEGVMDLADRHCSGRLVSLLEGGYDQDLLVELAGRHIRGLGRRKAA